MKITLDLMFLFPNLAGGRVYADGLLRGLAAFDSENDYLVVTRRGITLPALPPHRFRRLIAPIPARSTIRRTLWEYGALPGKVRGAGSDVFHGLGSIAPSARPCPFVLTIHDLIYREYPASWGWAERRFMHCVQPIVARRADRILVPSQWTARAVIEQMGIPESRIRVVPNGPGLELQRVADEDRIATTLRRHGVRRPFIVSVCRAYPHKNLAGLLRAVARLHADGIRDLQLVLVGSAHKTRQNLERLAAESNLTGVVRYTGEVSEADLEVLYTAAELFAFPSLAEGFGMPVLEAMACGTPVVASDASALPETVGPAAVLADARDPVAFAAALARVLGDSPLRDRLRRDGLAWAQKFSWERCAEGTLRVYRELA